MKRATLALTAFLALAGCTTLETVSQVDAQAAEAAQAVGNDSPVTLRRHGGQVDTVRITAVGQEEMTVRLENGDYEDLPYSVVESIEYTRPDKTANRLLFGAGTVLLLAGLAEVIESSLVAFPGP